MSPFRALNLKTRLILMTTVVTCATLIFSGGAILFYEYGRAKHTGVQNSLMLAEITAATSTAALLFRDQKSMNEYLSSLSYRSDVVAACIYDERGRIAGKFVREKTADCPNTPGKDGYSFDEKGFLLLFEPIDFENHRIGTIFVTSNLSNVRDELRFQVELIGSVLVLAVILSLLLSGVIQRYISRPILNLAALARAVSERKDYSIRSSVTTRDEIGVLAEAFNAMLGEIQKQTMQLWSATRVLESVLDSMGDGVVVTDESGNILVWNAATRAIMGSPERVPPEKWSETYGLFYSDEHTAYPTDRLPLVRAMRGEWVDQEEIFMNREGGAPTWLSVTARPLVSATEPRKVEGGGVAVVRNVTEHKHLEAEKERLLNEAREAVRVRDDFMSIASHELKTPLTPLRAQVQLLERLSKSGALGKLPPHQIEKLMNFTDSQITTLTDLIENLLDVTRIISGKLSLRPERVHLATMVREVLERYRGDIAHSGSSVTTDLDEEIVGTLDPARIEQVLTNLLTNALKYGQGKPISVSLSRRGANVELSVQDQGIGISKDNQARIFERFARAVPISHYGGLGLGLYIIKQIVVAHGGSVRLESELGRGTKFIVTLPLVYAGNG